VFLFPPRSLDRAFPDCDILEGSTLVACACRYSIVSGVKKGVIFSKAPDSVAYTQTLGKVGGNFGEREDYIIITNFDFFYHDIREYFDPTGGKVRR